MIGIGEVYICPMQVKVREPRPGKCPACGMDLVPEGLRFVILQHMANSPLIMTALMTVVMIGIMVALMKLT